MDKRERAATRAEQEQAQQAQRAAAFRVRDKALEENYLRYGCKVLKTGGSWAKETIRQADAWVAQNKERTRAPPSGARGQPVAGDYSSSCQQSKSSHLSTLLVLAGGKGGGARRRSGCRRDASCPASVRP